MGLTVAIQDNDARSKKTGKELGRVRRPVVIQKWLISRCDETSALSSFLNIQISALLKIAITKFFVS